MITEKTPHYDELEQNLKDKHQQNLVSMYLGKPTHSAKPIGNILASLLEDITAHEKIIRHPVQS